MTYRRKHKLRLSNTHLPLPHLATDVRRVNWEVPGGGRGGRWGAGARRATERHGGGGSSSGSSGGGGRGLLTNFVGGRGQGYLYLSPTCQKILPASMTLRHFLIGTCHGVVAQPHNNTNMTTKHVNKQRMRRVFSRDLKVGAYSTYLEGSVHMSAQFSQNEER